MCKVKCHCLYRITESTVAGETVYYPEYAKRLFPWRWKRLDISVYDQNAKRYVPLFFTNKQNAIIWLESFRQNHDPILSDRKYKKIHKWKKQSF